MPLSPLALAWVNSHLSRRGLTSEHTSESTVCDETISKRREHVTPLSSSSSLLSSPPSLSFSSSLLSGCVPSMESLLAAVGHRPIAEESQSPPPSSSPHVSSSSSKGGAKTSNTVDSEKEVKTADESLTHSQRSTPQRVASGVVKFVEQQAGRSSAANGPAQAYFVLHTVLTACVRHAVRYSRLDQSHDSISITTGEAGNDDIRAKHGTGEKRVAAASSQIQYPWSPHLASEHLREVMQDADVQKLLRSFLWKVVDREHKNLVRSAAALCAGEAAFLTEAGVHEEEVRGLFGITVDGLDHLRGMFSTSSFSFFSSSSSCSHVPATYMSLSLSCQQHVLPLLSERHFVFTTTSANLAELLRGEKGEREGGAGFASQLKDLLLEMARVRMAVALLLQFEIIARRYAALGKQQQKQKEERQTTQPQVNDDDMTAARDLCTLASAAGSRALEPGQHRRRFNTNFNVSLRTKQTNVSNDHDGGSGEPQPAGGPFYSLKSVFAALSPKGMTEGTMKETAQRDVNVDNKRPDSFDPLASTGVEMSPVEQDPLMRAVMELMPPSAKKKEAKINSSASSGRKGKRGRLPTKTENQQHHYHHHHEANKGAAALARGGSEKNMKKEEMKETVPTWCFRCSVGGSGAVLDAVDMPLCDVHDAKVHLHRPSTSVPWPFTLEVDAAGMDKDNNNDDNCYMREGGEKDSVRSNVSSTRVPVLAAVRMRFNPAWKRTAKGIITPTDMQHTTQLRRVLSHRNGNLLKMNGCPVEKLKSVMRIAERNVRLVVRFR